MSIQLDSAALKGKSAEEIVALYDAGQLDTLLGRLPGADVGALARAKAILAEHISDADAAKIDGAQEPGATGRKV